MWKHVAQDIQMKGVVRNYSTRPNEKMHGALKDAYQDRSNGKDITVQVCIHISKLALFPDAADRSYVSTTTIWP